MNAPAKRIDRRLVIALVAVPLAMLAIGMFLMPIGYTLWCRMTGTAIGGGSAVLGVGGTATGRLIEVHFSTAARDLPVTFTAGRRAQTVEVGMDAENIFTLRNDTDRRLHLRPVHAVSPGVAVTPFEMRQCFCFQPYWLAPREERTFTVRFAFNPSLDARVGQVLVHYALFAIADGESDTDHWQRVGREMAPHGGVVSPRPDAHGAAP